ncbi:MAG: ABC transporter permease [Bifidobacteriaceae bacterium]|jgi:peptide/nickel transport system permease protein|nr:ABC transporter permease [Bifidobacteriaceae bacterium]
MSQSAVTQHQPTRGQSQGQLVWRRFKRHRPAVLSAIVLVGLALLAVTSIGWGPIPGWWHKSYSALYPLANPDGGPTFSVDSAFPFIHPGAHPFGQDDIGHDMFAMTMRGFQQSLTVMFVMGFGAGLIGVVVGAVAGYFRGWVDGVLLRVIEMTTILPTGVVGAVLGNWAGGKGTSAVVLGAALALMAWPQMARLVRGEFFALREREFVDASRLAGASNRRLIFKHILPGAVGVVVVQTTLLMAVSMLTEVSLSYLGFGIKYPDTSLGTLIFEYKDTFDLRPWLFWWPGVLIVAVALAINFLGDGLRDAFDPQQRRLPTPGRLRRAARAAAKSASRSGKASITAADAAPNVPAEPSDHAEGPGAGTPSTAASPVPPADATESSDPPEGPANG